jgi:hypothetical protein
VAHPNGNTMSWYENNGNNTLTWTSHLITNSGNEVQSIFVEDVNGDGRLDVLVASTSPYYRGVAWFENVLGSPITWVRHFIMWVPGPYSVFVTRIDDDESLDILSVNYFDGTIWWYENVGGNGTTWVVHTIASDAPLAMSAVGWTGGRVCRQLPELPGCVVREHGGQSPNLDVPRYRRGGNR